MPPSARIESSNPAHVAAGSVAQSIERVQPTRIKADRVGECRLDLMPEALVISSAETHIFIKQHGRGLVDNRVPFTDKPVGKLRGTPSGKAKHGVWFRREQLLKVVGHKLGGVVGGW